MMIFSGIKSLIGNLNFWNVPEKGLRLIIANPNTNRNKTEVELKIMEIRSKRQSLGYKW